ncbi:hypothetical protein BDV98DRAFT_382655 [Pterulicium gracile]|uniref:Uncharacterized protein n=1 Tax=Pterulicium gracile TaxID=1884261 RepID=A0A5C3QN79_9AGAR|nr:hypothetical protein BDV98DRAFT_382655 [Pterula gracilis]
MSSSHPPGQYPPEDGARRPYLPHTPYPHRSPSILKDTALLWQLEHQKKEREENEILQAARELVNMRSPPRVKTGGHNSTTADLSHHYSRTSASRGIPHLYPPARGSPKGMIASSKLPPVIESRKSSFASTRSGADGDNFALGHSSKTTSSASSDSSGSSYHPSTSSRSHSVANSNHTTRASAGSRGSHKHSTVSAASLSSLTESRRSSFAEASPKQERAAGSHGTSSGRNGIGGGSGRHSGYFSRKSSMASATSGSSGSSFHLTRSEAYDSGSETEQSEGKYV